MQFRTSSLFALATFFAIVAWCFAGDTVGRYVASPTILGILASVRFRHSQPLKTAAVIGALFVAACVFIYWLMLLWGYVHHVDTFPYYEDGFASEVFAYPIIFCIIYCPVAALASTISGWIVLWCFSARMVA